MMAARDTRVPNTPLLGEILPAGLLPAGLERLPVSDLIQDSRQARPGCAFVALPGTRGHGLAHAAEAAARGAGVVLWDEAPNPEMTLAVPQVRVPGLRDRLPQMAQALYGAWPATDPVVAVTGTDGKTSVTHLIALALEHLGRPTGLMGTLGVGRPGHLVDTGHTTPGVIDLQRHLAALTDAGCRAVTLEASSHGLAQGRLAGAPIRVAVLTHLSSDHLDFHGTREAYAAAKARLFAWPGLQDAVLNLDDPFGRRMLADLPPGVRALTYSADGRPEADLRAHGIEATPAGLRFVLETGDQSRLVHSPLFGRFQVANLLATLATLRTLGVDLDAAVAAMAQLSGVPGRMERFPQASGALAVVDYAHTAEALASALKALRAHTRGRLSVVFGCGGERDRGKRPAMGAAACRGADVVFVTDDNPRGEDPAAIRAEILAGCADAAECHEIGDRATAIASALAEAGAGDVVLIAGKGHETTQEIHGVRYPFSDREQVGAGVGLQPAGAQTAAALKGMGET
ncbi:UDP-N-acetylmuramoyl-L-alanyl-D-glutamate--2,6-diaminopimelate ligase [Thioalkalivibrio sp. ALJ16]|uniref:UDP-N-acetylmuramoyl-L-alanyl-D-glutamate--2, 6-diaminopimelate ligase n=1 Tax=Thioalkalivibrio sp. ALJ16 TaxID=1158762 RepID=UPI00035EF9C0|nr:UDP-N-acetylmuramoyl-L-alanyl-D-glutamate--2,6-diaminopimelate ligase [Thioalkalivibrio sp. ALJ16]